MNTNIFSAEEEKFFPYQIYCDMDGVLVDLIGGIISATKTNPYKKEIRQLITEGWAFRKPHPNPEFERARLEIIKLVSKKTNFWVNLPTMSDKNTLWNYISQFDPYILSHPWDEASATGKEVWIQQHLKPNPELSFFSGDKYLWAVNENKEPNILIDDYEKNIVLWEDAGGIGIIHTSAKSTIEKLKQIKA